MNCSSRAVWRPHHVVDVSDAAFATRTYLEQADIRAFLRRITGQTRLGTACEVGAGYGRMTMILPEFANNVMGVEREPHLVQEAAKLLPHIGFIQVESLTELPLENDSFEFVLTFTVLQHLIDPVLHQVTQEIGRILSPGAHLLICEETDADHRTGALDDPAGMCTIGRSVEEYQRFFPRLDLLETRPRRIEPTYPRANVGTYMLFRK